VLGERFSAVDVYLASQIGWGMGTKRSKRGRHSNATRRAAPTDRLQTVYRGLADARLADCLATCAAAACGL
jgi:hypothetical protein